MTNELSVCKQRFRQVIGAMPCAYIYGEVLVNGNGEPEDYAILDVNHAFSRITGTIRDKVIGRRIVGLFSDSSAKDDISVFAGVALSGDPVEKEFYSPAFGSYFRVFCFSPAEGLFVAILTDLSKEKKLENHLDFIKNFCNSTADEFFVLDSSGRFVMGNEAVATKLDVPRDSIPGHCFSELNTTMEDEWWNALWISLVERGSLQFETDHRGSDGVAYPVELSVDLMQFEGRSYAAFVAKNISSKQIISKSLRHDRSLAEQAASMAGYFVWMIDSSGFFRPILGGNSSLVAGPVNEVFFSLFQREDREQLSNAIRVKSEGIKDLLMKTERGTLYHRFKWSLVEDNCLIGICYPINIPGLAGLGSESAAMDVITLMNESIFERVSQLEDAISKSNISGAARMARALTSDFSNMSGKSSFPEKVRFDSFLEASEGMLMHVLPSSTTLTIDSTKKSIGFCDPLSMESILVRLLLVIQSTSLVDSIKISSLSDSINAGLRLTVEGSDGIQEALEKSFIQRKGLKPGLASVYAMVRSGGGTVTYDIIDNQVEFCISFPRVLVDDESAFIIVSLPDEVDSARCSAALRNEGYSVAVEGSLQDILRRINEEETGIIVFSSSMLDYSLEDVVAKVSGIPWIQIGGEEKSQAAGYLPDGFRTGKLVECVNEIVKAKAETPQATDLPAEKF